MKYNVLTLLLVMVVLAACIEDETSNGNGSSNASSVATSSTTSSGLNNYILPSTWPVPSLTPPPGSTPKKLEYFLSGMANNGDVMFDSDGVSMTSKDVSNERVWAVGFEFSGSWDTAVEHFQSCLDGVEFKQYRLDPDSAIGGGNFDGLIHRIDTFDLEVRIHHDTISDEGYYILITDEFWPDPVPSGSTVSQTKH